LTQAARSQTCWSLGVAERHIGLDGGRSLVDAAHARTRVIGAVAPERRENHLAMDLGTGPFLTMADGVSKRAPTRLAERSQYWAGEMSELVFGQ